MHRCATLLRPLIQSPIGLTRPSTAASVSSVVRRVAPITLTRSFASADTTFVPKPVYSSYRIFKKSTALDIAVVRPTLGWNAEEVDQRRYLSLKRAGAFKFTFAPGEMQKSYDWSGSGESIFLSVTELGDLLAFAANKEQPELKYYHDPQLGKSGEGETKKELLIKRIGAGKPGYFFNFSLSEKESNSPPKKFSMSVTEGEFQVLLTLIQQTLPQLLVFQAKPTVQTSKKEEEASE